MSANKIPKLTASFWVMKICATTLGETAGDLLSQTLRVGYAKSTLILLSFFALSLLAQVLTTMHRPALYWLVILSTSTAGTTLSDYMDRTLHLGYVRGSALLMSLLAFVLGVWRYVEGSLSVNRIGSRRGELFYWGAILVSNTLGTALGDFLADSSGLGFTKSALLLGTLLAVIVALTYATRLSRVGLFWAAFVLTRPFGATFGDLLTKGHDRGGLGFGTRGSSAVLGGLLLALLLFTALRDRRSAKV